MLDLTKCVLPQSIEVCGSYYRIKTDFRYFLMLSNLFKRESITREDLTFMFEDNKVPPDLEETVKQLSAFMSPPQELPRRTGGESAETILDYTIDANYIYAAFYEQYRIDLLKVSLHWYQFTALLQGLHDTELNQIINARLYKPSGENTAYDKAQRKQYEAWRLPQPEDNEPDKALEEFLEELK